MELPNAYSLYYVTTPAAPLHIKNRVPEIRGFHVHDFGDGQKHDSLINKNHPLRTILCKAIRGEIGIRYTEGGETSD